MKIKYTTKPAGVGSKWVVLQDCGHTGNIITYAKPFVIDDLEDDFDMKDQVESDSDDGYPWDLNNLSGCFICIEHQAAWNPNNKQVRLATEQEIKDYENKLEKQK